MAGEGYWSGLVAEVDGKWRAPDSLGYNEHIGAVGAIVSQHLEEALTARFGLAWEARDDGHGFEIKGISGQGATCSAVGMS